MYSACVAQIQCMHNHRCCCLQVSHHQKAVFPLIYLVFYLSPAEALKMEVDEFHAASTC